MLTKTHKYECLLTICSKKYSFTQRMHEKHPEVENKRTERTEERPGGSWRVHSERRPIEERVSAHAHVAPHSHASQQYHRKQCGRVCTRVCCPPAALGPRPQHQHAPLSPSELRSGATPVCVGEHRRRIMFSLMGAHSLLNDCDITD